jgi:4-amino-4-deoxy-L-arabinose transferase-like glycosyltransferase
VYPNLWVNDGLVMSESVSCLMISLSLLALVTWADRPSLRVAAWIGVAAGLGTLARSEVVLLVPAAAVVMWVIARRSDVPPLGHVGLALGVAMVVVLPWVVFKRHALRSTGAAVHERRDHPARLEL